MKTYNLSVEKRTVLGKKVKKLRREGVLPANVYGKDMKSTAVQVTMKDFQKVYKEAGETGVVELDVVGEKRPVLIHNVQIDPISMDPVHADFFQVNLKEKVKTMVPVVITGEPKAVTDKVGLLLQTLSEVEVEALPTDLPENIEIDVTSLAAVNDQVTVADLKKPAGVEILSDGAQTVAKISELISKEAEEQAAADAAAAEAAKAEGTEGAEGEAPAEGGEAAKAEGEEKPQAEAPKEEQK
ncbi:MAG: 50S ribosomal protein L25 [Candidatus Levyibacteriota bacterium]